jgi:2-oxo-3-hexenedioate decarboxylase
VTPESAARTLREVRSARRTLAPLTDALPELDEEWGYAVQAEDRRSRIADGERVIGAKLGLTSVAKQQRMGVDRPIVGFLTDAMLVASDGIGAGLASWAQPRIEPEIAFVTALPIEHALTQGDVPAHIATVGMAAEIIDSRWSDYRFRLPDVVADNTSAAGVVLCGAPVSLADAGDLARLSCEVQVAGKPVHRATGAAILGQPLRAVRLLSEHLERHGEPLPAGSLILAGALTDAVPLTIGQQYRLAIAALGEVSFTLA